MDPPENIYRTGSIGIVLARSYELKTPSTTAVSVFPVVCSFYDFRITKERSR